MAPAVKKSRFMIWFWKLQTFLPAASSSLSEPPSLAWSKSANALMSKLILELGQCFLFVKFYFYDVFFPGDCYDSVSRKHKMKYFVDLFA